MRLVGVSMNSAFVLPCRVFSCLNFSNVHPKSQIAFAALWGSLTRVRVVQRRFSEGERFFGINGVVMGEIEIATPPNHCD